MNFAVGIEVWGGLTIVILYMLSGMKGGALNALEPAVHHCVVLTFIGLVTVLLKKNIIKILLGINILESAVNLFIVALGYREGGVAPIFTLAPSELMVLPPRRHWC